MKKLRPLGTKFTVIFEPILQYSYSYTLKNHHHVNRLSITYKIIDYDDVPRFPGDLMCERVEIVEEIGRKYI